MKVLPPIKSLIKKENADEINEVNREIYEENAEIEEKDEKEEVEKQKQEEKSKEEKRDEEGEEEEGEEEMEEMSTENSEENERRKTIKCIINKLNNENDLELGIRKNKIDKKCKKSNKKNELINNFQINKESPSNNIKINNFEEIFDNKFNNTFDNYEVFIKENRKWDNKSISYINNIKSKSILLIRYYNNEAKINKKKHLWLSFISVLIPLIFAPMSGILINIKYMKYVEMNIFILLSIINTIIIKFNYSKKLEKYTFLSIKYNDIISDIEYQLNKPELYRENVNIFCTKIKCKFNYLTRNSFII